MSREVSYEEAGLPAEAPTEQVLKAMPCWFNPVMGLDDLPDAYRGCPIRPEDQRGCIVAYWDTGRATWMFAESRAMLFGLVSAVLAFNRLPTLVVATVRRFMAVCAGAFFDDIACLGCASGEGSDQCSLNSVLRQMGFPAAPEKRATMGQHRVWLGTVCNLAEVVHTGEVLLRPKDSAVAQVMAGIGSAVRTNKLPKPKAAKLRGQTGWTGSLTSGKCGRIGHEVLKAKQYHGPPELSAFDREALIFLGVVVSNLPERSSLVAGARPPPLRLYTDASFEPESGLPPRMGWVLLPPGSQPLGRFVDVPPDMIASWTPRSTQIFPAEAMAVYAAIHCHAQELQGQDVIVFVDNEAAAAALIRGSSSSADVGVISQAVHWLLHRLHCRMWLEWTDSDSNISDGLSRDGASDRWTAEQGWDLAQGELPPWQHDLSTHRAICLKTLGLA